MVIGDVRVKTLFYESSEEIDLLPTWVLDLLSFLKDVSEKYIIPVVISVIFMIFTYYIVDPGNAFLVKVGVSFFLWFFLLAYFVIIELLIFIYKKIKNCIAANKEKKRQNELLLEKHKKKAQADKLYKEEKEKHDLEELRSFVDSLNKIDRGYLKKLIQTSNKPIVINEINAIESILFKSIYVYKAEAEEAKQLPMNTHRDNSNGKHNYIPIPTYDMKPAKLKFRLTDEAFNLLKLSQDKYGCISHFD